MPPLRLATVAFSLLSPLVAQEAFEHPDGTTHWYEVVPVAAGITWIEAHVAAAQAGGTLATIGSQAENDVLARLVDRADVWRRSNSSGEWLGPWFGGLQRPQSQEPGGGWQWIELEAFTYSRWAAGQPDNVAAADRLHFASPTARAGTWGDSPGSRRLRGYVVEYAGPHVRRTVGLLSSHEDVTPGYTLHNPLASRSTYLIDRRGRTVNTWQSQYPPGAAAYLLDNGHLLRAGRIGNPVFTAGGNGGVFEEFDWSGKLVWSFQFSNFNVCAHHDFARLPNGNLLILAWERVAQADAIAAGRDPASMNQGALWPEAIFEIEPSGSTGGRIVWEWHSWDHLIQDFDSTKKNFGDVGKHPELIDVNYRIDDIADWMHANALAYDADLDQIMLSVRSFDEIWIIDHSTTTKQAKGHKGGRSRRGGDLLYRWGNPRTYRAGSAGDRQLFRQHDAHWIPKGVPGAGNVLIFNNGDGRPGGDASSVDEIVLPTRNPGGSYQRPGRAFGPTAPVWTAGRPQLDFFSAFVSGAQRLKSGNTLICAGTQGTSLEVTPAVAILWAYRNPISATGPVSQGTVAAQTLGPRGTPVFRSPFYPPDFDGLRGHSLVPSGPVESHVRALLVDGSTTTAYKRPGTTADLTLRAQGSEGEVYIVATSFTKGLYPLDTRFVRLGYDPLLVLSSRGGAPATFQRYIGTVSASGTASAGIVIPNFPALIGLDLYTAFVADGKGAPNGLGFVSNTVQVRIVR